MWWKEPVTFLKGIGPKKADELAAVGVFTVGDLLEYYPRQEAYIDYGNLKKINELKLDGSRQIFRASVCNVRNGYGAHGKRYTQVLVRDDTAYATLYFFMHQSYAAQKLRIGSEIIVMGRVRPGKAHRVVSEIMLQSLAADELQKPEIVPVYALKGSLNQAQMRKWMRQALALAEAELPESLPPVIVMKCHLPDRLTALKNIHFPASWQALAAAKRRFIFEELFLLQCGLLSYRAHNLEQRQGVQHGPDGAKLQQVLANLPFTLTEQQQKAWREISADMQREQPMHRILQGDVGSGKTVISALALAKAVENGYQGCIMAPTEILARQHYETLQQFLQPAGIRIGLLVGGMRVKARRELLLNLELGLIDVLVGTHALLEEDVRFAKLSLAVTDEQHRFGVEQRARLTNKSATAPDVLVMTATPIPRTLALTVYGDLDISLMKGRPPGRKPVQTLCYNEAKRSEVYQGLLRQVQSGRQAYIVCPLIEESDALEARSAEKVYDELSKGVLKSVRCALLHGRLKPAEKEAIMADFVAGATRVLVSTTVIEVGVNVPNATLMVVRDSEDGFYLAEKDMEQRGVGQLFGLKQHGLPDLRIADIIRDTDTIVEVRKLAQEELSKPNALDEIHQLVQLQFGDRFAMIFNT